MEWRSRRRCPRALIVDIPTLGEELCDPGRDFQLTSSLVGRERGAVSRGAALIDSASSSPLPQSRQGGRCAEGKSKRSHAAALGGDEPEKRFSPSPLAAQRRSSRSETAWRPLSR